MSRHWRKQHRREAVELNITAFMNLMVILVPFLLITAVFSQVAILELNLPASSGDEIENEPPTMQLEVIVRGDRLEVGERSAGLLTSLPASASGQDFAGLTDYLKRVKARYPDKLDITVLLEPDVAYDVLVQVMDAVRLYRAKGATTGRPIKAELFPEIAIGDAPLLAKGD